MSSRKSRMVWPKYEKDPDSLPETPGHRERRLRYEHARYLSEVASARAMAHGTGCYEELEFLKSAERCHEQLSHKGELIRWASRKQ